MILLINCSTCGDTSSIKFLFINFSLRFPQSYSGTLTFLCISVFLLGWPCWRRRPHTVTQSTVIRVGWPATVSHSITHNKLCIKRRRYTVSIKQLCCWATNESDGKKKNITTKTTAQFFNEFMLCRNHKSKPATVYYFFVISNFANP